MKKVIETIWQYKLLVGTKLMEALGILMLLYELFSLIFKPEYLGKSCVKLGVFILIVLLSVGYALCSIFCKKKDLTISINKRTQMTIKKGDVFNTN